MKKLSFAIGFVLVILLVTGCLSKAQTEPAAIVADGAVVTATGSSSYTLRAYRPEIHVVFDTKEWQAPHGVSIILTNVAVQAVSTRGLAPVTVEILSPTSARYQFILPPGTTPAVSFVTATGPAFSFAVFGDNRDGRDVYLSLLDKINALRPEFAVNGGDLVPAGRAGEYEQFLADSARLTIPYYTALGNHDIQGDGRTLYNRLLAPNYYDFVWGNSLFLVLDNADGDMDARQLAWLENKLKERTARHTFIIMHKPPFDPRPGRSHTVNSRELADRLQNLAAQYGVTAVFCSHIHMYYQGERLGVPYYITGGAGAPLYAARAAGGVYHFVLVKVNGDVVEITPVQL
ncbi:metallophosphoesterase [Thermosinus carboxydivorans Nor1]|uniref:Metallophosphoesterase n=1 Tax=Thermosinus carboxydivorans Nor1 TaxID=401526 RepID=A1HNK3_9FIRM|nr:metallophosphoesterase [Thermosinus carboxydivorans]EAX48362.1 metallophosphoesterase [Thermosinus carboxydivorans Nor1]